MAGSMRQRGEESWQLRVHAGRDRLTGRKRYVERTFHGNKREASKALASLVVEAERLAPKGAREGTMEALLNEWFEHASQSFSPKTAAVVRGYLDSPIIPAIGAVPAARLTPAELDRFYRHLLTVGAARGPYKPATVKRVHGIIRRALTQGVRWGWLAHNPALDASPPRVPLTELKPPTPDEVVRLFRLAQDTDPELATFIVLAASSGARRGELVALRWRDLDLDRGTLSIERGVVLVDGKLIEQGTKTHQSRRVTLDAGTVAALREHPLSPRPGLRTKTPTCLRRLWRKPIRGVLRRRSKCGPQPRKNEVDAGLVAAGGILRVCADRIHHCFMVNAVGLADRDSCGTTTGFLLSALGFSPCPTTRRVQGSVGELVK
jgi:integrase